MIDLRNVVMQCGAFGLAGINLTVPSGRYAVLMGKTGSGKTTILEAIAGLRRVTGGSIRIANHEVTGLNPALRGLGYVPQDGAIFPTMTVAENLGFAMAIRKFQPNQIEARVAELSKWLRIENLLSRKAIGLSGGERQRVALGRAMAFHPKVLLLDEPLSAIDFELRGQMLELLETLKQAREVTILHVTHDLSEADRLADLLFQLVDGQVEVVQSNKPTP